MKKLYNKSNNNKMESLNGLMSLMREFPDEQTCINLFEKQRWNGQTVCAYCQSSKVYKISESKRYKCGSCKKSFSLTTGTIFENSKIPLRTWFIAISLLATHKKGYTATMLAADLEISIRS